MKKRVLAIGLMMAVVAMPALPAMAAEYLSPETTPLTAKERRVLGLIHTWSGAGSQAYMQGGKLVYVHGAAGGIPTIIAAPLQVVDVELEPGELVNEIVVGDSARWQVESGSAGSSTHLFIKPIDVGLESSAVVTTDRRVYHLRLISRKTDFTPYVGFIYSDDLRRQVAARKKESQRSAQWQSTTDDAGKAVDLAALNFGYEVKGKAPWRPERVYDDGRKMYIQLPASSRTGEMPALMVKKGAKDVLVNYRVRSGTMEVDGLFSHLALVVGVGRDQELVSIYKRGR
ncbi:MAG: P-type conjugative transfer protein TrbG [Desulfobulbus sp.]|jgi:P-type conjugative transfer protein TrbG